MEHIEINNEKFTPLKQNEIEEWRKSEETMFLGQDVHAELIAKKSQSMSKIFIIAATPEQLVNRVVSAAIFDSELAQRFFVTYCTYSDPMTILQTIQKRFQFTVEDYGLAEQKDIFDKWRPAVRLRACNAIKVWLESNGQELRNSPTFAFQLKSFIETAIKEFNTGQAQNLLTLFENTIREDRSDHIEFPEKIAPSVFKEKKEGFQHLFDLHPLELARQLSLFEWQQFRLITPNEINDWPWASKNKKEHCQNIFGMTKWFNRFTFWVASELLAQPTVAHRIAHIEFWLEVVHHCFELNNFNTMQEIISALQMVTVRRLKATWAGVAKAKLSEYEKFCEFLSDNNNYQLYRAKIKELQLQGEFAFLPFLGIHLRDAIFCHDGSPSNLIVDTTQKTIVNFGEGGHNRQGEARTMSMSLETVESIKMRHMVNFGKQWLVAESIIVMLHAQIKAYNFRTLDSIQKFLSAYATEFDEERLWTLSTSYDKDEKREEEKVSKESSRVLSTSTSFSGSSPFPSPTQNSPSRLPSNTLRGRSSLTAFRELFSGASGKRKVASWDSEHPSDFDRETLENLAKTLYETLETKDRTYHLRVYRRCWVATHAIQHLVSGSSLCKSREDAVTLLRQIQSLGYFYHVVDKNKQFSDTMLFFTWDKMHIPESWQSSPQLERHSHSRISHSSETISTGSEISSYGIDMGTAMRETVPSKVFEVLETVQVESVVMEVQTDPELSHLVWKFRTPKNIQETFSWISKFSKSLDDRAAIKLVFSTGGYITFKNCAYHSCQMNSK